MTSVEHEFFPTPAWCVDRVLEHPSIELPVGRIRLIEPCVGNGAIVSAVSKSFTQLDCCWRPSWEVCDIRPDSLEGYDGPQIIVTDCADGVDFLRRLKRDQAAPPLDMWCITNPPFSMALEFVQAAVAICDVTIFLLRIDFLGGPRCDWMRENEPRIFVLPERPSFRGDGTDMYNYAWFAWGLGSGVHVLESTPKSIRKEQARQAAAYLSGLELAHPQHELF